MRRIAILAAPLSIAALLFACEDDSTNGGTNVQLPDSSNEFDATTTFDASVPDAAPDANPGPLPVTVLVTDVTGAPRAGVSVVFHDAAGAVLETKATGADGKAVSTPSASLSMATAVLEKDRDQREILTWTNVQGGDVLPAVAPLTNTLAQLDITIPGQYDGQAGTTHNYTVFVGGCSFYTSDPSEPVSVYLEPYCFTGSGAALVYGADGDGNLIAFSTKKPLGSPSDGGTLPVTTDSWVLPSEVNVSVSNTTDPSGHVVFSQIANQTAFSETRYLGDVYQTTFKAVPGAFAEAYNATLSFQGNFAARTVLGKRVPASTTSITFDGNALPPALSAAAVDSTTANRPIASWIGNTASMKGGVVRLRWNDSDNERATNWSIVVPASNAQVGSVTAPALPNELAALVPTADAGGSTWYETPEVTFADSDLVADYAAWRKIQGLALASSILQGREADRVVLPQDGNFKVTSFHRPLED